MTPQKTGLLLHRQIINVADPLIGVGEGIDNPRPLNTSEFMVRCSPQQRRLAHTASRWSWKTSQLLIRRIYFCI